jgi:hypothetical protein
MGEIKKTDAIEIFSTKGAQPSHIGMGHRKYVGGV